ncbi:MAG: hypothetical protein ABI729_01240 [Chitinophagales bacterium]
MKTDSNGNNKNQTPSDNRNVPTEIESPIPKPERKEEDNDFTKKGDKNDPMKKEKIDQPSHAPVKEDHDESNDNYIQEPIAEDKETGEQSGSEGNSNTTEG